jgi:hypothetical protein
VDRRNRRKRRRTVERLNAAAAKALTDLWLCVLLFLIRRASVAQLTRTERVCMTKVIAQAALQEG